MGIGFCIGPGLMELIAPVVLEKTFFSLGSGSGFEPHYFFLIGGCIQLVTVLLYLILASGEFQDWAADKVSLELSVLEYYRSPT